MARSLLLLLIRPWSLESSRARWNFLLITPLILALFPRIRFALAPCLFSVTPGWSALFHLATPFVVRALSRWLSPEGVTVSGRPLSFQTRGGASSSTATTSPFLRFSPGSSIHERRKADRLDPAAPRPGR